MPSIFLSYRREDTAGHAGRLFDRLREHYGHAHVFWDVSGSIEPGEPFDESIERAVGGCDALLAVIGNRWLTSAGPDGSRRLDDPDDFVRLEVGKALRRDVRVVPVLVHGAELPAADDLPEDLRALARRQAIEISDGRWDYDVAQLIESLDRMLGRAETKRPKRWRLAAGLAGLAVAVGVGAWALLPYLRDDGPAPVPDDGPAVADREPDRGSEPARPDVTRPGGDTRVAVPDLRGVPLDVARARLSDLDLKVGQIQYYTLGRYERGVVYNHNPKAGVRVRPGAAVAVNVEREKLPGIQSSGVMYLSPNEIWDLDGAGGSRSGPDIRFEGRDPLRRLLQPINGAALAAAGREPVDRADCAGMSYATDAVPAEADRFVCVKTNRSRFGFVRMDAVGKELKISYDTWTTEAGPAGQVRLRDEQSYHFKTGATGRFTGGDLYLRIGEHGGAVFYANNAGQRGVADLGDLGAMPLGEVPIPDRGFTRFGVPVVEGNTYVALAREGEAGHHIVFRVVRHGDDSLTLSFEYR